MILSTALTSLIISMSLLMLTALISKKSLNKRKKWMAFECGFNPFKKSRNPFSMRFFLLAILFIIFDVEIVLILPILKSFMNANVTKWSLTTLTMFLILILGILVEWKEQTFSWKI